MGLPQMHNNEMSQLSNVEMNNNIEATFMVTVLFFYNQNLQVFLRKKKQPLSFRSLQDNGYLKNDIYFIV